MKQKKKNQAKDVKNVRRGGGSIFSDNKNIFMPIIFFAAAFVTVAVSYKANLMVSNSALKANNASMGVSGIEESGLEECTDPAIRDLISRYYTAIIEGNAEEVQKVYRGIDDLMGIKAAALSDVIERYDSIMVYTKPGPVPNSYIAFVYQKVKLYDYKEALPGLETLYICTDTENGELYIDDDTDDETVINYIKALNAQADVIDLNNKVSSEYNAMLNADDNLASLLSFKGKNITDQVKDKMQKMAENSAAAEAASDDAQDAGGPKVSIIRAKDVVKIRTGDSTDAEEIGKTELGQEFTELEALPSGWSKIDYNGSEAYVKTEFFDRISVGNDEGGEQSEDAATEASSEPADNSTEDSSTDKKDTDTNKSDGKGETKTVNGDSVRLRSGQGTDSAILTSMDKGATIKVLENYPSGWSKVEYEGQTGYIKSEFIDQ